MIITTAPAPAGFLGWLLGGRLQLSLPLVLALRVRYSSCFGVVVLGRDAPQLAPVPTAG